VTDALFEAGAPMSSDELAARHGVAEPAIEAALAELVKTGRVLQSPPAPSGRSPRYVWVANWRESERLRLSEQEQALREAVPACEEAPADRLDVDAEPALAFHDFVVNRYVPPQGKRLLVFLQCSVRRPFSSSPSHAFMKRAISTATGADPRQDAENCPVHVVVLASKIGPVPYEMEDTYPANVRGGGVKHYGKDHYARVRPVLAERMAQYMSVHGGDYESMVAFTEGRYGQVMTEARRIAGAEMSVLPVPHGPFVKHTRGAAPRTYWQRFWIQLFLEIVGWLSPEEQEQAEDRLAAMGVEYSNGTSARRGGAPA
jgi:predicted RNA-binding protein